MSDLTSFPELWVKNDRGELVVAPCLSFAIYLDETDAGQVLGFVQRAYEKLRPNLTHYIVERMRAPAKITPRAEGMVPAWLKRPNLGHEYRIQFWGGETSDISPWLTSRRSSCTRSRTGSGSRPDRHPSSVISRAKNCCRSSAGWRAC
jgi:hypothetical protein